MTFTTMKVKTNRTDLVPPLDKSERRGYNAFHDSCE